jgi:hypothetical protein
VKAKGTSKGGEDITRYDPIDGQAYPERVEAEGVEFFLLYCRPNFIVYEKYKNGVKLGYYVLPSEKDIFNFQTMLNYVETLKGKTLCKPRLQQLSKR